MSEKVTNISTAAQVALASYGDHHEELGLGRLLIELGVAEMSASQALIFAGADDDGGVSSTSGFEVVGTTEDNLSGFSATVFRSLSAGHLYVGIRGTDLEPGDPIETVQDLFSADLGDLGGDGLSVDQAIDMYNYYLRESAQEGETISQFSHNDLTGEISHSASEAERTGPLASQSFTAVGHSLGGHLATVLSRLAPDTVDEVFTFNAPGFDPFGTSPGSESFFNTLAQLETAANGRTSIRSDYDPEKLHHAVVPGDVVSQLGDAKADQTSFFSATEQRGTFDAHGILAFGDALAVYEVLGLIDDGLENKLDQSAEMFRGAANRGNGSIEYIVNAIGRLFPSAEFEPVADDDREALYSSLAALKNTIRGAGNLSVHSLVEMSADEIKTRAQGELAYRYALHELNPFVVTGDDSIYLAHSSGGELDLNQFSDDYLTDRATFLTALMSRNLRDADVLQGQSQRRFDDLQRGESLIDIGDTFLPTSRTQYSYLFASDTDDSSLSADDAVDHIYGRDGSDVIFGAAGDDYLEGNRGDDQLSGGTGADVLHGDSGEDVLFANDSANTNDESIDRLFGGTGLDQYYVGDNDEITDSDRRAEIFLGTSQISLGGTFHRVAASVYRDNERNITIYLQGASASVVAFDFEPVLRTRITNFADPINGFSNGDFGIYLEENPPAASGSVNPLVGSELPDTLSGGNADEQIEGLAGDDDLFGGAGFGPWGADRFFGGEGRDYMNSATVFDVATLTQSATDPGDWMDGGAGDDIVVGNGGDDQAYGGSGRDFLSGRDGSDVLTGGPGDDVLAGGGGDDLLIGGEGDDYLFSAFDVWASNARNWTAAPILNAAGRLIDVSLGGVIIGPNPPPDDRDVLHGGGGDDFLNGGNGDDTLFGEADADVLFGWRGHDVLDGGDGDDMLYGDTFGLTAGGADGDDNLSGGRGEDELWGEAGSDILNGGDDDDRLSGGPGDDTLAGDDGDDDLQGGAGADHLDGGAGDDALDGGAGADVLNGNAGDDTLEGGSGHDFFTYRVGGGHDVVSDSGGYDLLFIEGVIDLTAVPVVQDYESLTFNFDTDNSLTVTGWLDGGVDQIIGNGKVLLAGDFIGPESYQLLSARTDSLGDNAYSLSPASTAVLIDDQHGFDALVLGDGIDPQDVVGVVDGDDNWHGDVQGTPLTVTGWSTTALDRFIFSEGPELSYSDIDEASSHTPVLANPLADQNALAGFGYLLQLRSDTFTDGDYDDLVITTNALPDWLSFDGHSEVFSGTPGIDDTGTYTVTVTANDADGLHAADSFRVTVSSNPFSGSAALDPLLLGGGNGSWFGSKPPAAPAINFSFRHGVGSGAVGFRPPDDEPELIETRTFEAVQGVGDLNGDGRDDLLITEKVTYLGPTRTTERVVFGRADGYGQYLDTSAALLRGEALELISSVGGFFTETGDFNNDGIGDLVITPSGSGAVDNYIVYGSRNFEGQLDLDNASAGAVTRINGPQVTSIGDMNQDGIDDLVLFRSVIYGASDKLPELVDTQDLAPSQGFEFAFTAGFGTQRLNAAENIGDFDGDGLDDFLVVARGPDYSGDTFNIVRGEPEGLSPDFDIDDAELIRLSGNLRQVFRTPTGDFNGDGLSDIVLTGSDGLGAYNDMRVIFGTDAVGLKTIDVDGLDGSNGFRIQGGWALQGIGSADHGNELFNVGDINNDGIDDLGLSERAFLSVPGSGYVPFVYGHAGDFPAVLRVAELDDEDGFFALVPNLEVGNQRIAAAVPVGDVDGDGVADVVVSYAHGNAGYLTFGKPHLAGRLHAGTPANDILQAVEPFSILYGFDGNDTFDVRSRWGNTIVTGSGNNTVRIYGDPLIGEVPSDFSALDFSQRNPIVVFGGPGNDTFVINGQDTALHILDFAGGAGNSIAMGEGYSSADLRLSDGSIKLTFGSGQNEIHLLDFDPGDVLGGPRSIGSISFSDGTVLSYEALIARGFDLEGSSAGEVIHGTNVVDRIRALSGDDELSGGRGDDVLDGGDGDDVYVLAREDGHDLIVDSGGDDRVRWQAGIALADLSAHVDGSDVVISVAQGGSVTIESWGLDPSRAIEWFEFDDGLLVDAASILEDYLAVDVPVPDISVAEDSALSLIIPGHTFSRADVALSAVESGTDSLPGWLTFDSDSGLFSGVPQNDDVGTSVIQLTATTELGARVTDEFSLSVSNTNDVPVADNQLENIVLYAATANQFTLPHDTFSDVDEGDALTLGAVAENSTALPAWLNFEPVSASFLATPGADDVGEFVIEVMATDNAGASATNSFVIEVASGGARLYGTIGDDQLFGTPGPDVIIGRDGNDYLVGDDGDDHIKGNAGDDVIEAGAGDDIISGGGGDDTIFAGNGDNRILGGYGRNQITAGAGDDVIYGGPDADSIGAGDGNNLVLGKKGHDWITSGAGHDVIRGGHGDDVIASGAGDDVIAGGRGNDQIDAGNGANHVTGSYGDDFIVAGDGDDDLHGGAGEDTIDAGDGDNVVFGAAHNDWLVAGDGNDHIRGGPGDDFLRAGGGVNTLEGGTGDDHYALGRNNAYTTIIERSGRADRISFVDETIRPEHVWFSQSGDDLHIDLLGSSDEVRIENWFGSSNGQIESIALSNGSALEVAAVNQLVAAMAAFNHPSASEAGPQQSVDPFIEPVIAVAWGAA